MSAPVAFAPERSSVPKSKTPLLSSGVFCYIMRKIAVIDERAPKDAVRSLERLGYRVISLPPYSRLSDAVRSHTDMLLFRIGDRLFTYADYCDERMYVIDDLYMLLRDLGVTFSFLPEIPSEVYPEDAKINLLVMGRFVFAKCDSVSPTLLSYLKKSNYEIVCVKQGYPACTVLKLNDGAAITQDRGMASAMEKCGIRVTLIESGYFLLPPHEYGFIGGSAGVDGDTVYFTGRIEDHPSYEQIMTAIENEGMRAVSLSDGIPLDVGGILFC